MRDFYKHKPFFLAFQNLLNEKKKFLFVSILWKKFFSVKTKDKYILEKKNYSSNKLKNFFFQEKILLKMYF